jgi:predicted transcriptional regulator of viral defense system
MKSSSDSSLTTAISLFADSGGVMRTSQATAAGIAPRTLYWMRDHGYLDRLSRGVYHLRAHPLPANPDVVAVMQRIPKAIICLVSALEYYDVGTHIPGPIQIALPKGTKTPKIDRPRIKVFRMSDKSLNEGVTRIEMAGTRIAVFTLAKTVADCFKFRNSIGLDIAVEALKEVVGARRETPGEIMKYAKINRVDSVIRPYIEALL